MIKEYLKTKKIHNKVLLNLRYFWLLIFLVILYLFCNSIQSPKDNSLFHEDKGFWNFC